MFLIAGLGNVGENYKNTRHNIGFMVIDEITKSLSTTNINKPIFKSDTYKSNDVIFSKPLTYMNESGQSVIQISKYYHIEPSNIIIIHDDLDLPFGTVKFKLGGGHGGHNGLRSIDSHIGKDYIRVRIGIGKPKETQNVANWVLSDFSKEEFKLLPSIISHVIDAINAIKKYDLEKVKSTYTLKVTTWVFLQDIY